MPTATLPARSEVPMEFTWDLESIYATPDAWQADFDALSKHVDDIAAFQGKLGSSAGQLLACLKLRDEQGVTLGKLFSYAHMKHDEDTTNSAFQALNERIMGLYARLSSAVSFITPEILSLDAQTIADFRSAEPELNTYDHELESILRQKPHVRSAELENLLAQSIEVGGGASRIYDMLSDADMKFPVIRDEKGEEVELTHGRYIPMQQSPDRRVRKDSFEALYETYAKYRNTFASTYATSVKSDVFYARAHHYESAQEAALDPQAIPLQVYSNLVEHRREPPGLDASLSAHAQDHHGPGRTPPV